MFERFNPDARRVVIGGAEVAVDLGVDKAGPEHLLLSLARYGEGVGARALAEHGVTEAELRGAVDASQRRAGLSDAELAALRSVGIDPDEVFRRLEEAFGPEALVGSGESTGEPRRWRGLLGSPFDGRARKTLELSLREAVALRHRRIGSEHLLLALLREGVGEPLSTVLSAHGLTYDSVRQLTVAAHAETG